MYLPANCLQLFLSPAQLPLLLLQQEFARVAETYGDGTARLTPEENILFVNVPDLQLPAMLAEPIFAKFKVNPGGSCTSLQLLLT